MKYLLFISIFISYLFISHDIVVALNKSKPKKNQKIDPWEISVNYYQWFFCENNGYYNDKCIEKMKITFENSSNYHVSSITFILTIIKPHVTILYKKKHTVEVDLEPGEVGSCEEFYLDERVYEFEYGFNSENASSFFDIEIISVK